MKLHWLACCHLLMYAWMSAQQQCWIVHQHLPQLIPVRRTAHKNMACQQGYTSLHACVCAGKASLEVLTNTLGVPLGTAKQMVFKKRALLNIQPDDLLDRVRQVRHTPKHKQRWSLLHAYTIDCVKAPLCSAINRSAATAFSSTANCAALCFVGVCRGQLPQGWCC